MKQRLERGEPRDKEQDAVKSLLEAVRVKARDQLLRGCIFNDDGTSLVLEIGLSYVAIARKSC
jgi:hypothetical protein